MLWLLPLLLVTKVLAQSSGDLYRQAVAAGITYREAFNSYIRAKNQFLQYRTGATRSTAVRASTEALAKRNGWQIAHLRHLRQTLADVTHIANYPQTVVYLNLESEISALEGLTGELTAPQTFAAVNAAAKNWEERLELSDKLIAAARLQIAAARLANLQNQLAGFVAQQASPSANLNLVAQKLDSSTLLRQKVDQQLATYKTSYWSSQSFLAQLQQGQKLLEEAAKLLLELQ